MCKPNKLYFTNNGLEAMFRLYHGLMLFVTPRKWQSE